MDDATIISELSASYRRQIQWYRDLSGLVQKTLGQLVLSRGNVAGVMENFKKKQRLFSQIAEERNRIGSSASLWQTRKRLAASSRATDELDALLAQTERAILEFLDTEDQLKRYLEHIVHAAGRVNASTPPESKSVGCAADVPLNSETMPS